MNRKCLWVYSYIIIDNKKKLLNKVKVRDLENYKMERDVNAKDLINEGFEIKWELDDEVKCDHCGTYVKKEDAVPCM